MCIRDRLQELDAGFELDLDGLFELGLRSMLDGFARVIDARPRRP